MRITSLIRTSFCTKLGRYGTSAPVLQIRLCLPPAITKVSPTVSFCLWLHSLPLYVPLFSVCIYYILLLFLFPLLMSNDPVQPLCPHRANVSSCVINQTLIESILICEHDEPRESRCGRMKVTQTSCVQIVRILFVELYLQRVCSHGRAGNRAGKMKGAERASALVTGNAVLFKGCEFPL